MSNKELFDFVESKGEIDREEMIARFGANYRVPSYEKLSKSYIASRIAQGLSAARDEEGRRLVLAKRGKDNTVYVNIVACKSIKTLTHIRGRIEKDINGQTASLEKVDIQLEGLDGEIS